MKKYRVTLTEQERSELVELIASGKYRNTRQKRAQILLAADESEGGKQMSDVQIAQAYDVGIRTVERTRQRFVEESYEVALAGKKREVVKEKTFDSRAESKLIALRCSEVPSGYSKWTLRLLAEKMVELEYVEKMSHESVRRILKKHRLSPGRSNIG
jgi:transposase